MRRAFAATCLTVLAAFSSHTPGAPPTSRPPDAELTDDAVERGIAKAQACLWAKQARDGGWPGEGASPGTATALAAHVLMESGHSPLDPRMDKALKWLAAHPADSARCRALRCLAWQSANLRTVWQSPRSRRPYLQALLKAIPKGGFTDAPKPGGKGQADANLRALWVFYGLWAARAENLEIPAAAWRVLLKHWTGSQNADGGWGYAAGDASNVSMTAAGVWAVHVCDLELNSAKFIGVGNSPFCEPVARGLGWLDGHFAAFLGGRHRGRDGLPGCLFHLQHAAAATGQWQFAGRDLYRAGAAVLLETQQIEGHWASPRPVVATACGLSFLTSWRAPILLARLKYAGDWNNRPHAVANLTRWTNRNFCRSLDWQCLDVTTPVDIWSDARILLITGSTAPKLTPRDVASLRLFVLRGGAIFSCTEGDGAGFRDGIRQLYKRMFPRYRLAEAGPKHVVYTRKVHFDMRPRVKLHILSNGVRPLIIHTDHDLPLSWQLRKHTTQRWAFLVPLNVARYISDGFMWPPHGGAQWPKEPKAAPKRAITLARLKHGGACDPEPLAYERFARLMAVEAGLNVKVLGPIPIRDLAASGAAVATLTGTGALKLTPGEMVALKQFVARGGTLVVDAAGGNKEFADSAGEILTRIFGPDSLRPLTATAEIYTLKGRQIERARYRMRTRRRLGDKRTGNLQAVLIGGKRAGVIFSREDITAGLVGYPSWTIDGYRPETAFAILRNIVVLAAGRNRHPPR